MSESQNDKARVQKHHGLSVCVCMKSVWERLLQLLSIERIIIVNGQKGERVRVEKECAKVRDCYLGEGGSQGL